MIFSDCTFNGNNNSGVIEHDYDSSSGATTISLSNCIMRGNGEFGIETGYDRTGSEPTINAPDITVRDSDIAYNAKSGIFIGDENSGVCTIQKSDIHHNEEYGIVYDDSTGNQASSSNTIYGNTKANIYVLNGSTPTMTSNTINGSAVGIDLIDSNPTIRDNLIKDNDVGIDLMDSYPTIRGNRIENNDVGMHVPVGNAPTVEDNTFNANEIGGHVIGIEGGTVERNNFTDNTDAGLVLEDCLNFDVMDSSFANNNYGIKIIGGDHIDIKDVVMTGSTDAGIFGDVEANFSITNPKPQTTSMESDAGTRALYYLNEGSGSITQDASPNNNDGVLANNPTWIQGKWGNALNFNGIDQYVSVPDSPSLDITGTELSIETWIRVDQGVLGGNRVITSKEGSYKIGLNSDRYVMWGINTASSDGNWTTTDVRIPIGEWTYLSLIYNGVTVRIYTNAQEQYSLVYSGDVVTSGEVLGIGGTYSPGVGDFTDIFLGKIDEVRISDVARTLVEMQNTYSTPVTVTQIDSVKLDGISSASAFSVPIPIEQVNIVDSQSTFIKYLTFSGLVLDNVTGLPVDAAYIRIYNHEGELFFEEMTNQFGLVQREPVLQYTVTGSDKVDNNPMNVTVFKDGYVPWWPETHQTRNQDFEMIFDISENRAPELPEMLNNTPETTHQKKPTLTWNAAKDWNSDLIKYEINVYINELYGEEVLDEPIITRKTHFTFERNLRFNREYWVELRAFDPWGLDDSATFSFTTVNTPPTTPEVEFVESPVSSSDDIVLSMINESVDIDEDPVDRISYLIQWYRVGDPVDELIQSGINMTVLSSEETKEGDEIKVVIKPSDGIEFGPSRILFIDVVNFVPEITIPFVDVEINEDEVVYDIIDLNTLFTDRDGDDLFFSIDTERHVTGDIDLVSGNLTLIPDENWVGEDHIIIQARDTKYHDEAWPTVTINVTVLSVNDAPYFTFVNQEPVSKGKAVLVQDIQGAPLTITCQAVDPDEVYGDQFSFSTDFLDVVGEDLVGEDEFQFIERSGTLSIYLSNDLVGEHMFNLTVTDEQGASSDVTVRLVVDNKNDPPTVPSFLSPVDGAALEQEENEKLTFQIAPSTDPDENIPNSKELLTYDWEFGDGETLENGGTEVTHSYMVSGNYTVKVTVRDKAGEYRSAEITIGVTVPTDDEDYVDIEEKEDRTGLFLIIILIVIAVIALIIILAFVFRKDPLTDVAESEERAHEALVAKQQESALASQEKFQALMAGMGYAGDSGPALPSAQGEGGQDMAALPAASEPTPEGGEMPSQEYGGYEQQPPTEQAPGYEQPPVEQPPAYDQQAPMQAPPQEQPPMQAPPQQPPTEPAPVQPEQAPPPQPEQQPGTVPETEQPQAQGNLPAPEDQEQQ
ncbi:MAG: right-handed parallel beta-helix repeat-containing protein [Thermoplasmatota archaeon]